MATKMVATWRVVTICLDKVSSQMQGFFAFQEQKHVELACVITNEEHSNEF